MRVPTKTSNGDVGFQIAPMIDVVFVILVFFMALAAQIRIEQVLKTKLPGVAVSGAATEFIDEQIVQISEIGEVTLNDEVFDSVDSRTLPDLRATFVRLKQSCDAAQSKVVVTLISHPDSPYARTIDVLNVLAGVGITHVTFTSEAGI